MRSIRSLFAAVVTLAALATPGSAQTLLGRVLDQVNEQPVGGVIVSLVARSGEEQVRTLSDSIGRFVLSPPEAGEFLLVTERFGYLETRSPLLALSTEGEAPIELMVSPSPIGLEGLEISVEEAAAEQLSIMGLSANQLGRRWIDRRTIEAIQVKRDMGVILENTSQSGIRVVRPENLTTGSENMGLCVSLQRARRAEGRGTCALIVLNGVPISGIQALNIPAETIESMALLNPVEAVTQYGTLAGSGAVLVWTRHGR
ncbi:MAG: carboxypeptidase-like regulatory domain-containing protein [Gemmatimonadota bacterium]